MSTIVIKLWHVLVSEVYSSDPDTGVIVIDEDCGEEQPADIELPAHQVY